MTRFSMPRVWALALLLGLVTPAARAGDDVRCVQDALAATAFSAGEPDGIWGRRTEAGVTDILAHLGLSAAGTTKEHAAELCALLRGLSPDQLTLAAIRSYPVRIEPDGLAAINGRPAFDTSRIDIDSARTETCAFQIFRRVFEDGREEMLASGTLSIEAGHLRFGPHSWRTGGRADASYLTDQAALVVDRSGRIHGPMPFFHMFIRPGEESPPPVMVELGLRKKQDEVGPRTVGWFDVNSWGDGFLLVYGCRA